MFKTLVYLHPEKSPRAKAGIEPGSPALVADALTTRPLRRWAIGQANTLLSDFADVDRFNGFVRASPADADRFNGLFRVSPADADRFNGLFRVSPADADRFNGLLGFLLQMRTASMVCWSFSCRCGPHQWSVRAFPSDVDRINSLLGLFLQMWTASMVC